MSAALITLTRGSRVRALLGSEETAVEALLSAVGSRSSANSLQGTVESSDWQSLLAEALH